MHWLVALQGAKGKRFAEHYVLVQPPVTLYNQLHVIIEQDRVLQIQSNSYNSWER